MRILLPLALALLGCGDNIAAPPVQWEGTFPGGVARPEHPRPDLRRDSFINLNTRWQFAYDPDDRGVAERWFESSSSSIWTESIQLPFAWDSPLSGLVDRPDRYVALGNLDSPTYRGVAWYRLELPGFLPETPGLDWHLVFGAVDFAATVYVNGEELGSHRGGYAPFSVDLSRAVAPGEIATIVVRVEDLTDVDPADLPQPVGKQGGFWYARTSGIWQTVYLEQRPAATVVSYRVTPATGAASVSVRLDGAAAGATLTVSAAREATPDVEVGRLSVPVDGDRVDLELPLDEVVRWSPEAPELYALTFELEQRGASDRVHGYFGLVDVSTDWLPGRSPDDGAAVADQAQALFINGRPEYLRCVLDQSYWPDGVLTAPSERAIRADLEAARDLGFNCVRVHVKVDEPIKYRILDEMGFVVLYDFAALDLRAANTGPEFAGRALFEEHLRAAIARDANHPSIAGWIVFNENWGLSAEGGGDITPLADSAETLEWARSMVALTRQLDPTRPVEDNSAGGLVERYEHFDTDLNTFHNYEDDLGRFRQELAAEAAVTFPGSDANFIGGGRQTGAPWMISEVGPFSFLGNPTPETFCTLWGLINEIRREPRLSGYVVTQLTDVEFEVNGMLTYDREPKPIECEVGDLDHGDVFAGDFAAFEDLPGRAVSAGAPATFALRYSHVSGGDLDRRLVLRWADGSARVEQALAVTAFASTDQTATIATPSRTGPALLIAEVVDGAGRRISANRLPVIVE